MRRVPVLGRPPRPLVALLAAVLVCGLAWTLATPAFQAPDEASHFAYAQSLAERFKLPGTPGRDTWSREQTAAAAASNADQAGGVPEVKLEWSRSVYTRWLRRERSLSGRERSNGGGPNPAQGNPPAYYVLEAGIYRLAGGQLFDRVFAMRLGSLAWLLVTVTATWLLAGELFRRDRLLQTVAGAVAGLFPMVTFVSTSVSPDPMLYALWSLVLWLGVRVVRHGLRTGDGLALAAITALAILTKFTSYALLPGVALALVVGLWRRRGAGLHRLAPTLGGAGLALAVPVGGWLALKGHLRRASTEPLGVNVGHHLNVTGFVSYLWQFYLPRLSFQRPVAEFSSLPLYDAWVKEAWAAFGLLEVGLPWPVYVGFAAIIVVIALAAVVALWRRRQALDPWIIAFFGLTALALLAGLHWTEYQYILSHHAAFNQGRYLFPLTALAGVAVAQALTLLPRRRWAPMAGAVCGGLLAFQLLSLGIMAGRFYA